MLIYLVFSGSVIEKKGLEKIPRCITSENDLAWIVDIQIFSFSCLEMIKACANCNGTRINFSNGPIATLRGSVPMTKSLPNSQHMSRFLLALHTSHRFKLLSPTKLQPREPDGLKSDPNLCSFPLFVGQILSTAC